MARKSLVLTAALAAMIAGTAAQARPDHPEVEPNDGKASATPATMPCGDTVSGTTTGAVATAGPTSYDYFLISGPTQAAGIYKYTMTLSSDTPGHTATIRGLNQAAGVVGATDSTVQTGVVVGTNRVNTWYGFGNGGQVQYRVAGAAATTSPYTATLTCEPIAANVMSGFLIPGSSVTVKPDPATEAAIDTDFWVYDSNFNAIADFGHDDADGTGVTRTLDAGTYYIAISTYNMCNNLPSPADDTFRTGIVLDHPNVVADSSTAIANSVGMQVTDGITTLAAVGAKSNPFDVVWFRFQVLTPSAPYALGVAAPSPVPQGSATTLTLSVTAAPGSSLDNITAVRADVSPISGNPADTNVLFARNGGSADWTYTIAMANGAVGPHIVNFTITDPQSPGGNGSGQMNLTVGPPAPSSDGCGGATQITALPYTDGPIAVGGATEDVDVACNEGAAFATRSGIWYRYVPAANQRVQIAETSAQNAVIALFNGGCNGLFEIHCSDPETFLYDVSAGVEYLILVGSFSAAGAPIDATFTLQMTEITIPANDECANAIAVTPGSSTEGNNIGTTGADESSCAGTADTHDVWYRMPVAVTGSYVFDTVGGSGSLGDTTLSLFGSCGGAQIACNDDSVGLRSRIEIILTAPSEIFIRVAGYNSTEGTFTLNIAAPVPPPPAPSNDGCGSATVIAALPFNQGPVEVGGAAEDLDVGCNAAAAFATQNGIWYTFTPAENQLVRIAETGATDVVIAVFTGGCAGTETACSAADSFVFAMTGGTEYHILIGATAAAALPLAATYTVEITEVVPPSNDTCDTARLIDSSPFVETIDATTASNDLDVACNGANNTESRFGVWYRFTPTENGAMAIADTSANDIVFTVFEGGCAGLTEGACTTAEPSGALAMSAGTQYFILVSMFSDVTVPTTSYGLTFTYTPAPGACCVAGTCIVVNGSAECQAQGGAWQGAGVTCGGPTSYTLAAGTTTFEDISATGAILGTISACDDCVESTSIGFTFNYLGTTYDTVSVCSNGFVQFGGANNNLGNVAIPNAAVPNNMICVLWDDWNPGTAGDVFALTDGSAPNRRFVVSWQGVPQFANTDVNSFQVVLHEGTNAVEFRYELITAEGAAGDYTVGYENALGTEGASFNPPDLGSGSLSVGLTPAGVQSNPCTTGGTGACCAGSSCSVVAQAACAGAGTRYVGSGSACNASGNNTAPCCRADFNQDGAVAVQDILDYLGAWFVRAPSAEFDGAPTVTLQDLFDFLGGWFARCG